MGHSDSARPTGAIKGGEYLRRFEVANRLGLSVDTIESWASAASGPPLWCWAAFPLYPVAELDAWLRSDLGAARMRAEKMVG